MSQVSVSSPESDRHSWHGGESIDLNGEKLTERRFVGVSRFATSSAVVFLVGIIIIGLAAWGGVSTSHLVDCLLSGLCCLSGAMVGHLPLMLLRSDEVEKLPTTIFMGTVLRSSVALITVIALIVSGTVDAKMAAFSFFGWYAVYLIVDLVHGVRAISIAFPKCDARSSGDAEPKVTAEPAAEGV